VTGGNRGGGGTQLRIEKRRVESIEENNKNHPYSGEMITKRKGRGESNKDKGLLFFQAKDREKKGRYPSSDRGSTIFKRKKNTINYQRDEQPENGTERIKPTLEKDHGGEDSVLVQNELYCVGKRKND